MNTETVRKEISPEKPSSGGNFWFLLAGLLFTLLAVPVTHQFSGMERYSMTLLFSVFMLVSIWSLAASRRVFQIGVLLVIGITAIVGISAFNGTHFFQEVLGIVLMLTFCVLSCWIAARNVFLLHKADLNSLAGAFCVYLLIGLIWALLYKLLLLFDLAAFSGNITAQEQEQFPDLLYFSFVTLASLGYGDVTPIGGLVRTFAYLEAVIGQFYLAVMVASLVSAYSAHRTK